MHQAMPTSSRAPIEYVPVPTAMLEEWNNKTIFLYGKTNIFIVYSSNRAAAHRLYKKRHGFI